MEDTRDLRAELERAEQKIAALRALAANRKLQYDRAQAELDRIRRRLSYRISTQLRAGMRAELRAFCLFIGYPRSGHSLLGSLLDAHPDIAIAHGANVLKDVARGGVDRDSLIEQLVRSAAADADRIGGRRASGYSYAVPGQWQGQVRRLRVVGAKAGEKAALSIRRVPGALEQLRRMMRARIQLLHVTRNPFDMIARAASITKDGVPERTIAAATDFTARLARINALVIAERPNDVLTVRHESLVRDPRRELRRICSFLQVEHDDAWLDACASLVFERPQQARQLVEWSAGEREAIEHLIAEHTFFHGYSWSSES